MKKFKPSTTTISNSETPMPKPTRTINLLHPPDDVTMEELEGYWGTPDDVKPISQLMKENNIPLYPKKKVKPF